MQSQIFEELWPCYGIAKNGKQINLAALFDGSNPIVLEVGFGNGEHIFHLAQTQEDKNFIGVEVYQPGIINLLSLLKKNPRSNLRIYQGDVVGFLQLIAIHDLFHKVFILFPDPWPRRRHHKRRLIQPGFIDTLHEKIIPGGALQIATDWEDYAEHIMGLFGKDKRFSKSKSAMERGVVTKFEKQGIKKNHSIFDFVFINNKSGQ